MPELPFVFGKSQAQLYACPPKVVLFFVPHGGKLTSLHEMHNSPGGVWVEEDVESSETLCTSMLLTEGNPPPHEQKAKKLMMSWRLCEFLPKLMERIR